MMTNLDRLNELLADRKLDLPQHRRVVDTSGGNLKWLREHIRKRNTISEDLTVLLDMPIQDLVKTVNV